MPFSPGRSTRDLSCYSISFTKFHAGLLFGGIFFVMAASFCLGYAIADWQSGPAAKLIQVASPGNPHSAPKPTITKTNGFTSRPGGKSRSVVMLGGKGEEDIKIQPSFYRALLEKDTRKEEKIRPLPLQASSPPMKVVRDERTLDKREGFREKSPSPTTRKLASPRPDEPTKAALSFPQNENSGRYTIHITSVREPATAIRITRKLQEGGFPAFIQRIEEEGKGAWYRIRVGRFSDRNAAGQALAHLRSRASVPKGQIIPF